MTDSSSHLNVEETGGIVFACFTHQPQFAVFDLATAFENLLEPVSKCSTRSLIVDLTPVTYMDSSSLGELARLKRMVEIGGGKIALCKVAATLHEILKVIRFDALFTIFDDRESAVAWISDDAE